MKLPKTLLGPILPALILALANPGPSPGGEIKAVPQSVPLPIHRRGQAPADPIEIDPKLEASAVEPIGDGRYVLVAHDKASQFYLVEAATGRIVDDAVVSDALPPTTAAGPKYEAMARDSRGRFYVMSSHSGKTPAEKLEKAHLLRFSTNKDARIPSIDAASVSRFDALGPLADALGKESKEVNKLKVEGLAIRERPGSPARPATTEIVVGLREPSDLVRAFVARLEENSPAGSPLAFEKLFAFDAGLREGVPAQLTSLTYVPAWKGFFILTATEGADNVFHGNTLWFLGDDRIPGDGLARPERVLDFEVAMKAEGVADIPDQTLTATSLKLVIVYDNDAKSTKIPSRIQILQLTRPEPRD